MPHLDGGRGSEWLVDPSCPLTPDHQKTVLDYYANLWQTDGRTVDDLLADLPPTLRIRLSTIVNRNVIKCGRCETTQLR